MVLKLLALILTFIFALSAEAGPASVEIPQGRIWRLAETGYLEEAEQLEKSIESFLKTQPIDQVAYLGGGVSITYLVRFEHNVYAVLKLSDPMYPRSYLHEVAAYKLDRLFGVHMVPLTVTREVNGRNYSLQLYYPGEDLQKPIETDFQSRLSDLKVFDYLISQGDREDATKNTFVAEDGRRIAIDQARVFLQFSPAELGNLNYGQPSDEIKRRILEVSKTEVRKTLQGLLTEKQIRQVLLRLTELKSDFSKNPPAARPSKPSERWPEMKNEFKLPEAALRYDFWDDFGVWNILMNQKGKKLTTDAIELIQRNSSSSSRRKLLGAIFRRWPEFTNEVKKEWLARLWSPETAAVLKLYRSTMLDVLQLDPSKEKELLGSASDSRSVAPVTCSAVHL